MTGWTLAGRVPGAAVVADAASTEAPGAGFVGWEDTADVQPADMAAAATIRAVMRRTHESHHNRARMRRRATTEAYTVVP